MNLRRPPPILLVPLGAAALALVLAGRLAVADGYGPTTAPGTGYAATAAIVDAGQSYAVRSSDAVIRFATTDAGATATLPGPSYVSERHTAVWAGWTAAQVPPVVTASGALMLVGDAGLLDATTISPVGASRSFTWTGSEWAAQ
jgi:hypothetical protein